MNQNHGTADDHLERVGAESANVIDIDINSHNTVDSYNNFFVNYAPTIQLLSNETSIPLGVLRCILESMGETELAEANLVKIEQLLRDKAKHYQSLEKELRVLKGDDPKVQCLREAARKALQEGRFQGVEELLRQAQEHVHAAGRALRKEEAEIAAERANAAQLQYNPTAYRKAAALFDEAAYLVVKDDVHKARAYQFQQASVLDDLGREFGDNDALREAIALYRQILANIDRVTDLLNWAVTQNNLGNALSTLSEREGGEGGKARLDEAIAAYRAALEERTRKRVPLDWAATQNNLGNALRTLGEWEEGEGGKARLDEAIATYREALQEYTRERERVPLDWAGIQNNLGNALSTLGEREKGESGTTRLDEAVAAYRAALQGYTRERVPLDWAMTQNNLGTALQKLGEWEEGKGGKAYLHEAIDAYRAALKERTRERVPLKWAATQNNLGLALRELGEREGDTRSLEAAVAAHRAALAVYEASGASFYVMAKRNLARSEAALERARKN